MKTYVFAMVSFVALGACLGQVPDSRKAGFGSYEAYQAKLDAELSATQAQNAISVTDIATAALDAVDEVETSASATTSNAVGISSENDFDAVSNARSIEEDAKYIATNRDSYVQIQPSALPERPKGNGASLVEFALSTNNRVGQALYSRFIPGAQNRALKNCAKFASSDLAQEYFLANGGPTRNPKGLDPDGDGFACHWDPAPFRAFSR